VLLPEREDAAVNLRMPPVPEMLAEMIRSEGQFGAVGAVNGPRH